MKNFLLILVLVLLLSACGGNQAETDLPLSTTPTPSPTQTQATEPAERQEITGENGEELFGFPLLQNSFEGVNIDIWTPWPQDNDNKPNWVLDFEEWTGATVTWTGVPAGDGARELQEVLINSFAAGVGPDAFRGNLFAVPTWANRNLIQPWSDYIDYYNGPSARNIAGANIHSFSIGDDIYGLSAAENFIWNMQVLYYSRAVMDANGLEDPLELFLRGEWTYDVFADYVQRLTFDSGVGHIDHYGIAQWANMLFSSVYTSNGGNVVTIIDGVPTFTLHHHEAVSALNWFFENVSPFRAPTSERDPSAWFFTGNIGFYLDGLWFINSARMIHGSDLSFVPWPLGPDANTQSGTRIWVDQGWTWFLTASSKNPEATAAYFEWELFLPYRTGLDTEPEPRNYNDFINEDYYNLIMNWQRDAVISNAHSYGDLYEFLKPNFRWPLENHEFTPAVLTQRIAQEAQAIIDEAMRR